VNKIQATVIVRRLDTIERIEHLIAIGEGRRNTTLREIERHRAALAQVLRESIRQIEDTELKVIGPPIVAAETPNQEAA
jgi:hypothetical protein